MMWTSSPTDEGAIVLPEHVKAETAKLVGALARGEATSSHQRLVRLKAAALIGWLAGHPGEVTDDDWSAAGVLAGIDRKVRKRVAAEGQRIEQAKATGKGKTAAAARIAEAGETAKRIEELEEKLVARFKDNGGDLEKALKCRYPKEWRQLTGQTNDELRTIIKERAESGD